MSTRLFFSLTFLVLLGLGLVAYILKPENKINNKTLLIWTTDPNPQRTPQVAAYNKLYPQNFLRIDPGSVGPMKVIIQTSAGIGPDIIGQITETNLQTYIDAGILMDITDAASEMGFGPESVPESVRPLIMIKTVDKNGNIKKSQFVYPCNTYQTFLLYNKNIFDKYNVPYPSADMTWEKYVEIGRKLTKFEKKNDKMPITFGSTESELKIILWGKGGSILNKDGTRCTLNTKAAFEAFQLKHDLIYKYMIEPSPTQNAAGASQGGWGGGISDFGSGKVGIYWGARWILIGIRRFVDQQRKLKAKWIKEHPNAKKYTGPKLLRLGACKVPRFKNRKRVTRNGARRVGINKASKQREQALTFLQYLASAEYSKIINDGADAKPGNKKYSTIKLFINPRWLGEEEVHQVSLDATPDGRIVNRSLFISNAKVMRIFESASANIISRQKVTPAQIKAILSKTANEIDITIARNIKRNKHLHKAYQNMLQNGAQTIKFNLKGISR